MHSAMHCLRQGQFFDVHHTLSRRQTEKWRLQCSASNQLLRQGSVELLHNLKLHQGHPLTPAWHRSCHLSTCLKIWHMSYTLPAANCELRCCRNGQA